MHMLVAKLFKSAIYIIALAAISSAGAILIHSILAYTGPSSEPPDGNISAISTSGWTTSGTNVYLSTLTDYVGIGTASPNKQLHIKTAAGSNAELDIQSGIKDYWAVYQDETTEELRFWNTNATDTNIGSGNGNIFVIKNDGTILAKTPNPETDPDNAVATMGYVDAAAGGGDATLENQESIMGNEFDETTDSLRQISLNMCDATSENQNAIIQNQLSLLGASNSNSGSMFVESGGNYRFYKECGNQKCCSYFTVDWSGNTAGTNINLGSQCDTNGNTCIIGTGGGGGSARCSSSGCPITGGNATDGTCDGDSDGSTDITAITSGSNPACSNRVGWKEDPNDSNASIEGTAIVSNTFDGSPTDKTCDADGDGLIDYTGYESGSKSGDIRGIDFNDNAADSSASQTGTIIYLTTATTNGNIGRRSGVDSFCASYKPSALQCNNIHAFVTSGDYLFDKANDEIRDMPTNYGYNLSSPIFWYHSTNKNLTRLAANWNDMLDGFIESSQYTGTGINESVWTGSGPAGQDLGSNCNLWYFTTGFSGIIGSPSTTYGEWLNTNFSISCSSTYRIRCACTP